MCAVVERAGEQERRVLRAHVGDTQFEHLLEALVVMEPAERVEVPDHLLRVGRVAPTVCEFVELVRSAAVGDDRDRGGNEFRRCLLGILHVRVVDGASTRAGVVVRPDTAEQLEQRRSALALHRALVVRRRPAHPMQRGSNQCPDHALEPRASGIVDDAVEGVERAGQPFPHGQLGVVTEAAGELTELRGRARPRDREREFMVDQVVALQRRQLGDARGDRLPQRADVLRAIEPRTARVDVHPLGIEWQLDVLFTRSEERTLSRLLVAASAREQNRNCPDRVVDDAVETKALLPESQRARCHELGLDHRVAALEDPRVHHLAHRLAGRRLDRVPQVRGLGVAELVHGQVVTDAASELVLAQVLLQHPENGRALLVREDVEHPFCVAG